MHGGRHPVTSARPHTPADGVVVGGHAQCVRHPNASPLTYRGTNTWLLAAPGASWAVVVDPGPDDPSCLERIEAALTARGMGVSAVLLTHDHADHAGCAVAAAARFDAPVRGLRAGTLAAGPLVVDGTDLVLEVLELAGHSSDSVGFYVPDGDLIVTGDVLFAQSPTMVCWPDGRMGDYLASLDRLAHFVSERGVRHLCTAHGAVIDDPRGRIDAARAHRARRLNQVVAAVRSGIPADAPALVEAIYNDVAPDLHDAAVRSVNAQLRYAYDEGLLQEHRSTR
nr:MBL fold metallo-hydrolase [Adlercreutzia mucosicola]